MQAAAAVKTIAANLPKAAAKTDKQQQQQPAPPPPQLGDVVQEAKQQAVEVRPILVSDMLRVMTKCRTKLSDDAQGPVYYHI